VYRAREISLRFSCSGHERAATGLGVLRLRAPRPATARDGPYRAELRGSGGAVEVARLAPLDGGQLAGYRIFSDDVRGGSAFVIVDRHGRVVLRGALTTSSR
jgi:hypothetical protein